MDADCSPQPTRNLWDSNDRYKLLPGVNNAIVKEMSHEGRFRALARQIRRLVEYDRLSNNIYDSASKMLRWFASAEGVSFQYPGRHRRLAEHLYLLSCPTRNGIRLAASGHVGDSALGPLPQILFLPIAFGVVATVPVRTERHIFTRIYADDEHVAFP